uniref:Uncharacterized protein n=1 Tax=Setaria italica TaxID=4555 RepID=K3Y433_SETIT
MRPEFMEEDAGRRVSGTLELLRVEAAGARGQERPPELASATAAARPPARAKDNCEA